MNPIDWTDQCVRLECDQCGAHTLIEPRRYVLAVGRGEEIPCGICGGQETAHDRRRFDRPMAVERRLPAT